MSASVSTGTTPPELHGRDLREIVEVSDRDDLIALVTFAGPHAQVIRLGRDRFDTGAAIPASLRSADHCAPVEAAIIVIEPEAGRRRLAIARALG